MILETTWCVLAGYILGSIPFGYLIYHWRQGKDIRSTGSGNIGATNVLRAAGFGAAAATLVLDAGKGWAAVALASRLSGGNLALIGLGAFAAIAGHCFSVFLKFHGGKGVATGLGAFLAVSPAAILICAAIFVLVAAVWRYVSLASIAAAGAFPLVLLARNAASPPLLGAALAGAALIIERHRANIHRLRTGTEPRIPGWTNCRPGSGTTSRT
jgi:acyl phosphate:glycerol-3-phosphate acyltransferase